VEYKCTTIDMSRLNVGPKGFVMPICEICKTKDCSNPIEKTKISILGVKKEIRVFSRGIGAKFVVKCEGFTR